VNLPFRCAVASEARDDATAGTASTVRAFLLVEQTGPWGIEALRDSRLPTAVKQELAAAARRTGVRVLLVRRPGRAVRRGPVTAFAAYADPWRPWLERTELDRVEDVLDLDLDALAAGSSTGLVPHPEPVLAVCTHGRHDACCAERGRPVVAALTEVFPEETWECSHIGGDRFAANLLVLPDGLYHGRIDPEAAVAVAREYREGRLLLHGLRGRSGLAMPVQAAEIVLRRELGERSARALRYVGREVDGATTVARFRHLPGSPELGEPELGEPDTGAEYAVEVRTTMSADRQPLTCRSARTSAWPAHDVVAIRPEAPGHSEPGERR